MKSETKRYYVGQLDGYVQPHGIGRLVGDGSWIYEGEFSGGLPNGFGRYMDANNVYIGSW